MDKTNKEAIKMKTNNLLVLAGALLAGLSYSAGKKAGKKELICKIQNELLKGFIKSRKGEES